ncbi:hypothetical protein B0I33_104158 [Prauserella shujinwangii]|uniref:Proline-rich protein n=1 Tax=Prauserella shujinwangii TaxID=1453103 RepID=A0A2T0LWE2_9PSEU|nr:hypothetical protein [Prauserella shujinwangii]PRX48342.1 hypothetical protein B0I33_104158 [Prauserella shujinwangii]
MSDQSPPAVRGYLARVRTALADLPAAEVDEILDDVRPHLLEIAAELGERAGVDAMSERIGTPEAYAAELRAAGDYPPPPPGEETEGTGAATAGRGLPRLVLWSLVACVCGLALTGLVAGLSLSEEPLLALLLIVPVLAASGWFVWRHGTERVADLPEVRRLLQALRPRAGEPAGGLPGYLRSLRPAWWLLCATVLVLFGLLLVLRSRDAFLVLPLLLVLAAAAMWSGPRSVRDARLLWLSLPLSALVAGSALGLLGFAGERVSGNFGYHTSPYAYEPANTVNGEPALFYGEHPVENVYVFDSEGEPVTDVYLYDQDGRPLTMPRHVCRPETGTTSVVGRDNRYPRPHIEQGAYDERGDLNGYDAYLPHCTQTDQVPFTAVVPRTQPAEPTR